MNVVLYGEGSSELGGSSTMLPAVGEPLPDSALGAAHLLVRRALAEITSSEPAAIVFRSPLRVPPGRQAKGSDLINTAILRRLLRWPRREHIPHLAVILVDGDGDGQRGTRLRNATADVDVHLVVAIAVQEFEAWLIADHDRLGSLIGAGVLDGTTDDPESLPPRQAKELFMRWSANANVAEVRRTVAAECDLQKIAKRCRSFADLLRDLRQVPPT